MFRMIGTNIYLIIFTDISTYGVLLISFQLSVGTCLNILNDTNSVHIVNHNFISISPFIICATQTFRTKGNHFAPTNSLVDSQP